MGRSLSSFFRLSSRPFCCYRAFILKLFGAKLDIYPSATIWAPWDLEMDDNACIANDVICCNMATVVIEEKAVISQGTHLCTGHMIIPNGIEVPAYVQREEVERRILFLGRFHEKKNLHSLVQAVNTISDTEYKKSPFTLIIAGWWDPGL